MINKFYIGDIVKMRKVHPCGSDEWEVIRVGADIKIKCLGCSRIVMIPRSKFQKGVKKIYINKEGCNNPLLMLEYLIVIPAMLEHSRSPEGGGVNDEKI